MQLLFQLNLIISIAFGWSNSDKTSSHRQYNVISLMEPTLVVTTQPSVIFFVSSLTFTVWNIRERYPSSDGQSISRFNICLESRLKYIQRLRMKPSNLVPFLASIISISTYLLSQASSVTCADVDSSPYSLFSCNIFHDIRWPLLLSWNSIK